MAPSDRAAPKNDRRPRIRNRDHAERGNPVGIAAIDQWNQTVPLCKASKRKIAPGSSVTTSIKTAAVSAKSAEISRRAIDCKLSGKTGSLKFKTSSLEGDPLFLETCLA
jgi:hypothetical protein